MCHGYSDLFLEDKIGSSFGMGWKRQYFYMLLEIENFGAENFH